ncbi:hypothetical protein AYK24_09335 [Thermoplasmatales archaeon SG8-52-4]|nr:MAG: hypothetical protein AYK24_09335 [Thermoplasmatales archaeon SG8-52-4]
MEKRGKSFSLIIFIFFIAFFIWTLLQFLAPFAFPYATIDDLSGLTAISDNEKLIENMPFPWNTIYNCGDRLCHQKAERSFFLNLNQMPFCSRCTAIWLGLAIGLGFMVFYKIELNEKFLYLIFIGLIPIGIDGVGQLIGLWESTNVIRVITGLLVGVVCGIAIGVIIDEIKSIAKEKKVV